ncbi:MAG: hypothetical protein KAR14_15645, partial [Candidatus Aminicenantes bacterium]|nr:hypothetical protein [Candidatus Aminicenantes bacterium]
KNVSDRMKRNFIYLGYTFNLYELLWKFDMKLRSQRHIDSLWMLRSGVSLLNKEYKKQYWEKIKEYFKEENESSSHYFSIGKYLTGQISLDDLSPLMKTINQKCELLFYIGLKMESEGKMKQASYYYRACVDTGLKKNIEYDWSNSKLNKWARDKKFLSDR